MTDKMIMAKTEITTPGCRYHYQLGFGKLMRARECSCLQDHACITPTTGFIFAVLEVGIRAGR
jgi:hypothetical protein